MVIVASALDCSLTDLLPGGKSFELDVSFRADDVRRVQEAVAVIAAVLTPRKGFRLACASRSRRPAASRL
jgi:hypothetical protein